MLRELAAALPEVRRVSTYDAEHDRPMVAVDEALGLVRVDRLSSWSTRTEPAGA